MVYRIVHSSIFRKRKNSTKHLFNDEYSTEENDMKTTPIQISSFRKTFRKESETDLTQERKIQGLNHYVNELCRRTALLYYVITYAMLNAVAAVCQGVSSVTEAVYEFLRDLSLVVQCYLFKLIKCLQKCTLKMIPDSVYVFSARCFAVYAPDVKYRKCRVFILEKIPSRYIKKASLLYVKFYSIPNQVDHMCQSFKENGCCATFLAVAKQLIQLPLKLVTLVAMAIACCSRTLERVTKVDALRRKKSIKSEKSK